MKGGNGKPDAAEGLSDRKLISLRNSFNAREIAGMYGLNVQGTHNRLSKLKKMHQLEYPKIRHGNRLEDHDERREEWRRLWKTGIRQRQIAEMHGVSQTLVCNTVNEDA